MSYDGAHSLRQSVSGAPSRSDSQLSRKSTPSAIEPTRHEPTITEQHPAPKPLTRSDTASGASALGFGGPSDWEHFGEGADEIDDTAMYGTKSPEEDASAHAFASVELPASPVRERERRDSNVSEPDDGRWKSSAPAPAPLNIRRPESVVQQPKSTPPPQGGFQHAPPPAQSGLVQAPQQMPIHAQATQPQASPNVVMDDPDYIPPMPPTPPPAGARNRTPIVLGGSAPSQPHAPLQHAASIVMDDGGWQPQVSQPARSNESMAHEMHVQVPQPVGHPSPSAFVMGEPGIQHQGQEKNQRSMAGSAQSTTISHHDMEALANAQTEVRELREKLEQANSALAQRSSELAQKNTAIAEAEAAIQKLKESSELQKSASDKQMEDLKKAQAEQTSLRKKISHFEAEMNATKGRHDFEKTALEKKVAEGEAAVATATAALEDLNNQLDEAKDRAAAPVDIAPGLDPWFKGSLERYKDMIETESKPLPVKEKLQIFMDFVNAEARLRGIDLPFGPSGEVKGFTQQAASPPREKVAPAPIQTSQKPQLNSPRDSEGFVMVDDDLDVQYSPGGRPIIRLAKSTQSINPTSKNAEREGPQELASIQNEPATAEPKSAYQPFRRESVETTPAVAIAASTPDIDKVTFPIPPPVEESKPAYQKFAYKPGGEQAVTTPPVVSTPPAVVEPVYKPAASSWTPPVAKPQLQMKRGESDDSFLKQVPDQKEPQVVSHIVDAMIPQPLKPKTPAPPQQPAAIETKQAQRPSSNLPPVEAFAELLPPAQMPDSVVSKSVQNIRAALASYPSDFTFINDLAKTWETKAAQTRSRLDAERRKRQAETEKRSNELYDDQEINYGDLETLERTAKEEELERKAKEDTDEFESYGREVFEPIFNRLHGEFN
jgi:hypothetical protein